jgi:hypothetical protein
MAPDLEDAVLKARTQPLVHVALALTLVVAQFLALAHGYSHLRDGEPRGSSTQVCSECLASSPLLSGADAPVHALALLHAGHSAPFVLPTESVVERFRHRPFQSRAPPA